MKILIMHLEYRYIHFPFVKILPAYLHICPAAIIIMILILFI